MTRPLDPPSWATDGNYPAGGETWSATPTKVAPIAGLRATGYVPEQMPSAQVDNYDKNLSGQWLTYFQDMQAMNWPMRTEIGTVVANGNRASAIAHTTAPSIVMVGGVAGNAHAIKYSLDGGQTWFSATTANDNTDQTLNSVAASGSTLIAAGPGLGGSIGSQDIYRSTDGGVNWTGDVTLPATSTGTLFSINHVHRANSVFVAGGRDHAGVMYIATSANGADGTWTQRTLTGGSGARQVLKIVSSASRIVAFGEDNGGASALGWYSDDAGVTWTAFTPPANRILAAAYSPETDVWMAIGLSGVGPDGTVYISANGIAWGSSLATLANTGFLAGGNQLTVSGALWVAAAPVASALAGMIYWSSNAGVNWRCARIGSEGRAVRAVAYAPQTQVGFHGGISLGEAVNAGSDWDTSYRQSMRLGSPPFVV